ncbi:MBL fold metallo-hydrolase [Lysobacter enzymogenes]|uniref:Metallo-beta-lactamase family protein n=1 Tax=Lysobacter enzymogenes TaxID=69 RepID=A0A0S2DGH5_LYSEN|nr:MBL fold metallo-hydrolase [Lysobacter enzymogenes]ALN57750.1 metallo-beta-lactamase family protein [Lysobacter enzymogenes]QCW26290.1 MBL fold metallo-hydrolase [Lysobacter enzymogenes]QQP99128.1 MBL fold metallo-hydrolase [Lysobacter enzymogenes]
MSAVPTARLLFAIAAFAALTGPAAAATPLRIEVYNPGEKGVFPVSSELVIGERDVLLVDAQFQRADAQALVEKIRATGKKLSAVYISQSDPDYYFGLDVIRDAFPDARILATPQTVAAIRKTMDGKLAYWGPVLKDNAPKRLVAPEPLQGDTLTLEGRTLKIEGLRGPDPARTYLWIPSLKTVAGGVVVSSGGHVFMADTATAASRAAWLQTLRGIRALKPVKVIPGHFLGPMPKGLDAVEFTAAYIERFEREAAKASDSKQLIAAMQAAYPKLGETASLELSAKVVKGEMQWPAPQP